jgi:hypothetical protein
MSANFVVYNADNVLLYNPKTTLSGYFADINVKIAWGERPRPLFNVPWYAIWDTDLYLSLLNNPIIDNESKIISNNGNVQTQSGSDGAVLQPFDGVEPIRITFSFGDWEKPIELTNFPSFAVDSDIWYSIKAMPVPREPSRLPTQYKFCDVLIHIYVADNARNFKNGGNGSSQLNGSSLTFEFNYTFLN